MSYKTSHPKPLKGEEKIVFQREALAEGEIQ